MESFQPDSRGALPWQDLVAQFIGTYSGAWQVSPTGMKSPVWVRVRAAGVWAAGGRHSTWYESGVNGRSGVALNPRDSQPWKAPQSQRAAQSQAQAQTPQAPVLSCPSRQRGPKTDYLGRNAAQKLSGLVSLLGMCCAACVEQS